ncbi:MAG: cytochrome c oxidase, subunit [Actinomycetia bacterium]|nr:cytochrome c oxidase, subunit [Actinomycetes bacterium]
MTTTDPAVGRPEAPGLVYSPPVPLLVPVPPPPPAKRRGYSTGFWGIALVITTESMIFLALLASYFFLRATSHQWPPPGIEKPDLQTGWIFSVVLIGSSIPVLWAEVAIARGKVGQLRAGLMISFLMGTAFLLYTYDDFQKLHFGWKDNAYASIFYVTVGLHSLHVLAGLLISLVTQVKAWLGLFDAEHHVSVQIFSLYWHFVDGVWIFVFSSLFLSAHIR